MTRSHINIFHIVQHESIHEQIHIYYSSEPWKYENISIIFINDTWCFIYLQPAFNIVSFKKKISLTPRLEWDLIGCPCGLMEMTLLTINLNSLWPSDTICRHKSGSTLVQVMACCLTAPSHYLNQCWLIISKDKRYLSECNFTRDTSASSHWN